MLGFAPLQGFLGLDMSLNASISIRGKIRDLQQGQVPIHEEGLEALVEEGLTRANLSFHLTLSETLLDAEFIFLCVPTPQSEDGRADLSYVLQAACNVASFMRGGETLVVKSTVPLGAARLIIEAINRPDVDYVSNPEFLREGTALWDFFNPERLVVGSSNSKAAEAVADLYGRVGVPTIVTSTSSAELIKYASNSFLALKLSFVNEMASICEEADADIRDVAKGMGLDSRIGDKFLRPGPGWGGSCFPKDTKALVAISESVGAPSLIVRAAIESNTLVFDRIVERFSSQLGGLTGKRIAVWGIAFKANTDDTRESPALAVVSRIISAGGTVYAYDPVAKVPSEYPEVFQTSTAYDAVVDADGLIVLTEWPEFHLLSAKDALPLMKARNVFDVRGILNATWETQSDLILVGR